MQTHGWTARIAGILAGCLAWCAAAANDPGTEFFENRVRPVLAEHCLGCHGAGVGQPKGGLRLDTRAGRNKGGANGPVIAPGKASESPLIKAIRREKGVEPMPPEGDGRRPLNLSERAALEEWVAMGAPSPADAQPSLKGTDPARHWAFQRPVLPPVPAVRDHGWPRAALDLHVLAGLERHGLKPSPEADGRTWLRRVTFDLTGLPPTMDEMDSFLGDAPENAHERAVDRLLASPRFGERWGRWWLDVARYADSKGYVFEEERRYAYSHTYRDWVVRALNRDLPYDRFLMEQIAGDRMTTAGDPWPMAALGFLTLGRRFLNNPNDIIDDRIDVVFRGTQALTVGCARCHDHKSDPIPTADYYALHGVFASSEEPGEKPLLGPNPNPHRAAEYEAERRKREKDLADYRAEQTALVLKKLRERIGDELLTAQEAAALDGSATEALARGRSLDPGLISAWKDYLASSRSNGDGPWGPWHALASLGTNDFAAQARRRIEAWNAEGSAKANPWVLEALREVAPTNMTSVAAAYGRAFARADKAWNDARDEARKAGKPEPESLGDSPAEALRRVLHGPSSPILAATRDINRFFETSVAQKSRAMVRKVEELDATHPGAPLRAMALVDKAQPVEPVVFKRGNPGSHGPKVQRKFLTALPLPGSAPFKDGSGRLEMARLIASEENPLTARVMVNRVWGQLVGQPMVTAVSDFGTRTEPPLNPALLDHLAVRFMQQGWSTKTLVRDIVLSATYRQASGPRDSDGASSAFQANAAIDPANAWHWRMNRKRMDFEGLHDSILFAAGTLDEAIGGQPVDMFDSMESRRRTLYGFIDRQNLPGVLRSFDFANPDTTVARRFQTTVPQQALFMLNNKFVGEAARAAAIAANARDDAARIRALYRAFFQRDPDADEVRAGRVFVASQSAVVPEPRPAATWAFGTGRWVSRTGRLEDFMPFKVFKEKDGRWQASGEFPAKDSSAYASLKAKGGHPGRDNAAAVVRRWTAPTSADVTITGDINHPSEAGDGVDALVVSSRRGVLGRWHVHHGIASTAVQAFRVERGEVVDFVVLPGATDHSDSFDWAPVVRMTGTGEGAMALMGPRSWEAARDFRGPTKDAPALDAWGRYAQVLLSSNEFVFID